MNLIRMIEEQLSGDTLDKISSVVGADPDRTARAASAAVPTLLASLAKLVSNQDGVRKLTNVLGDFDSSAIGNVAQLVSGGSEGWINKGTSLLGSLFGDNLLSSIASAISRFAGLDQGIAKKLVAMVAPLVLGKVMQQWKSQGGTPTALTSLLAEQERYIPDSLPPGYSLDQIPGWSGAADAVRAATHTTRRAADTAERAAPSVASWLLPLAALLVGALLLWYFLRPRAETAPTAAREATTQGDRVTAMKPAVPETPTIPDLPSVSGLTDQLNTTFRTLGETFASIKDAASAEAAAPKLEELSTTIDSIKRSMAQLPEAGRATLQRTVEQQLNPIKDQAQRTLELPGLSERIKQLIAQIVRKLEEWNVLARTG
jgi:hypothetical protein